MRTMLNTILAIAFFAAAYQVAWSIQVKKVAPQIGGVIAGAVSTVNEFRQPESQAVEFHEAYQRYVEHLVHTKYADRLALEEERVKRHLAIIKEQLEVQQRILEEARRP